MQNSQLEHLLKEQPRLHAHYDGDQLLAREHYNWSIDRDILNWILQNVGADSKTLETGCGYSTITFGIAGTEHTAISPMSAEHESISAWCAKNNIDLNNVEFIAAPSQDVIHSLPKTPLDLVLIDGDHAFPAPFIDWYYIAERVRQGGFVIVDDTQLITGKILHDFLCKEKGRWVLERQFGNTSVFRRVTSELVVKGIWWDLQPYCQIRKKPKRTLMQRVFIKAARLFFNENDFR